MFRFAKDGRVRWPVSVEQVQADGSTATQSFAAVFVTLTRDELRTRDAAMIEYTRQMRALLPTDGQPDTDANSIQRQALTDARMSADDALLLSRVKDWDGIADQDDQPLPFSGDTLTALVNNELMRGVLLNGLIDASSGARSKNSQPGLAGLPAPAQA